VLTTVCDPSLEVNSRLRGALHSRCCMDCIGGHYFSKACTGSDAGLCSPCQTCDPSHYARGCNPRGTNMGECTLCTGECQQGYFATTPCSAAADTGCKPWTVCKNDEFQGSAPSATTDRQCIPLSIPCPQIGLTCANGGAVVGTAGKCTCECAVGYSGATCATADA
jgi:hypothetical protein